ncbi:exopolysacharide protein Wzm [Oenococcus oeni]|nr:exopolysacharide protein Wzm [Oenococcus oeni]
MQKKIMLLDTSVSSENLGDFIIMDAVYKELHGIFPNAFFANAATHDTVGIAARKIHELYDYTFIGGTNLLSGIYLGRNRMQWKMGFKDSKQFNDVIGLALGWSNYLNYSAIKYRPFVLLQKLFYQRIMNSRIIHSVRDSYTQKKFDEYGIKSINTSCVTMWQLTENYLSHIKRDKSSAAILTITDYCADEEYLLAYREMIEIVLKNYGTVFLWLQSPADLKIVKSLDIKDFSRIKIVPPNLESYNYILGKGVDYIGTRLHGGIRSLQKGNRSLIIEVDNRAKEIAKDTNLPTLNYKNIDRLDDWINHDQIMDVHVPFDNIAKWKAQFE